MASNIFLGTGDQPAVVNELGKLLQRGEHAADPEGLLGAPAPILVSPAHQGWVAICGVRGFLDDLVWTAAELSRSCATRAVACELIGNSYAFRLSQYERGELREQQQSPKAGWSGRTDELASMPLYDDAELLGFQALRSAGVPLPLVLLGTCPLTRPAPAMVLLGTGTSLGGPDLAAALPVEVSSPELPGEDPPVLPTGSSEDFGMMLFEDRYVEGRPSKAAVDRLLAIEDELLARARRACPDAQVTLTATYHAGAHQDLLDQELQARGRPTAAHLERVHHIPWWQFWRHFGRMR